MRRVPRVVRQPQMLHMAAKVFGRHGYENTSMNEIAKACGISKPMLYAYFGSKEGLYSAIINHAGIFIVQEMATLAFERDPTKRLQKAAAVLIAFVEQYRDSWQMVFSSHHQQPSINAYRQHILSATIMTLAQFRPGELPKERAMKLVEPYAHVFLAGSEAAAQWWVGNPSVPREELGAISEEMIASSITTVTKVLANATAAPVAAKATTKRRTK